MRNKSGAAVLPGRLAIQACDACTLRESLRWWWVQLSLPFPGCLPVSKPPCPVEQCLRVAAEVSVFGFTDTGPETWRGVSLGLNSVGHESGRLVPCAAQCHGWVPDTEGQICSWFLINVLFYVCVFSIRSHKSEEFRGGLTLAKSNG